MAQVQTVQGPVDAGELGTVLIHEHVRFRDEAVAANWPGQYDGEAELAAALEAVNAARDRGVRTIVDPTAMFGGRDVHFMAQVAEQTGVQIVACTGIYTYDYLPQFLANRDEDGIAAIFLHEFEHGMQGTGVKPAFLKCAADAPGVTPNIEKVHRAVARAAKQSGKPIMAHSHPASGTGLEQMRIFSEEGVDPATVQIAHTGDTDDLDYIERLLDTGCWIGMDRYGLDLYLPTEQRNATVLALLERGYAERMFLSQDYCSSIDWFPREVQDYLKANEVPDWSMTFLFEQVIPTLKERGMSDDDVDQMMVENPKLWLGS
jgi:phosphotriesterase-related protein